MAIKRHLFPIVVWITLFFVVASAVLVGLLAFAVKAPYKGYAAESVLVRIPPHSPTVAILAALEQGGVIRDRRLALITLKVLHRGRTLKAGEYRFAGPRSVEQVVLSIAAGDVVTYRVTVPEGFTADEVFSLFTSQGFGAESECQSLFTRAGEFDGVPKGAPTLEGFLFPDTYTVTRSMGTREIITMMTRQFHRRLPKGYEDSARRRGLSVLQAATLASLIEKETALTSEREVVSAVYWNRLKRGMLLQCDPTTIYALKLLHTWRGGLARSELTVAHPYNTYVNPGLPPGPICNPGLASLRAALAPADVPHLFFVAAGDGSHFFSTDYEDQQKNIVKYREAQRTAREAEKAEKAEAAPAIP
ncbi:MAG: endolytic transglycosylase MltG [Thermoanaerobaculia bacterium]